MGGKYDHSQVLVDLIQQNKIERFAEIGVWKGKTARYILRHDVPSLKEYFAIDQYRVLDQRHGRMGLLTQSDWDDKYKRECWDMVFFDRFRIMRLPSCEASILFPDHYFDIVFIDGSHFKDDVKSDIKAWIGKVRKGGLLTGHDYNSSRHREVKPAVDEVLGQENIEVSKLGCVWIHKIV